MTDLTVGAGIPRGLLTFAAGKGASPDELATRAGLDVAALADQDARIPMAVYVRLMRAAKEMCGDPALALHYGEQVDFSELSIAGLIMNASETIGEAFAQLNRFGKLAAEVEGVGAEDRFQVVVERGQPWVVDRRANPDEFPELTEGAFARMICGPRRFLPRPHVLEVHFTHAGFGDLAEYERVLRCPVVFGAARNAMRIDITLMSHRVALQPRYVFGVLSQRAEELLRELASSKSTRGRVESALIPILHTGDVGMDAIAKKLATSRQTLYRNLKAEGVTFEELLDELRHRMALHYLRGKKVSVNETAYLVGFSDATAFSRAFKRWTGTTPRAVRESSK